VQFCSQNMERPVTGVTEDQGIPAYKTGVAIRAILDRRMFLQTAIAAAAAAGLGCGRDGTPWRFFTVDEARTLAAMCEQIIPADQDPGAAWAGVVNYIDRQLCGPLRRLRQTYRVGIAAVEESSRRLHSRAFADLDSQQQTEFLRAMEAGTVSGEVWKKVASAEFFGLVIDHTMQGFYGDPRHGGNRDGVSWKMLGLPYPPIRGRLKYDLTKT
jgi:gluconate 2-dehydrogenase gamma chain